MYDSMMMIVVAGLGTTVAEKFANPNLYAQK
jgi:hypothetical protein